MGCGFSCGSSPALTAIRVVHLDGYVEDFTYPVTVREVIMGKSPTHFVCTQTQLVSGGPKPLKLDSQLEPGHVYFLLPYSTLQPDVSPVELTSFARKLSSVAKTGQSKAKSPSRNSSAGSSPVWSSPSRNSSGGSIPAWKSPARSPSRFSDQPVKVEPENSVDAFGLGRSSKARSWKPILESIRERSFNRRSESDLQDKHLEISKIV
ncbi:hypothetical protein U1Q18_026631 [Sarracenia purpurea var. burkii]